MFPSTTTDEVLEIAATVGRRTAREIPGLEAEDITAEAVTRLVAKADKLGDPEPGYIYRVLERDAHQYASKERYDYLIGTSEYLYRPREVTALLKEAYWDPTMWDVPSAKDDR